MQPGKRPQRRGQSANSSALVEAIEQDLQARLGAKRFAMWCQGKIKLSIAGDQLTVGVGSPFLLGWMQKNFRTIIAASAQQILGPSAHVAFEVDASLSIGASKAAAPSAAPAVSPVARKTSAPRRPANPRQPAASRQPEATPTPPANSRPAKSTETSRTAVLPSTSQRNRIYADLADFVPGPGTELALTAARQIAERKPVRFNPLVMYGPCGTGKTHLAEGIYKQLRQSPHAPHVMMITAEAFANYFTQALRDHTLPDFRMRFRNVDVLIIEDIEFFESKKAFQEELLHTISELADYGRQVVVTCQRHPRLLTKLGDELVSRFLSGLVCRLESPDLATRKKIVARQAVALGAEFPTEVLDYVAQRFPANVRELHGALNCLHAYGSMSNRKVSMTAARQLLSDLERDCMRIVRLADVERVVCSLFGVKTKDLHSVSRARTVSQPRMLAMFLARRWTQSAYTEIGAHFGGRNHSTVMSAERRVQQWIDEQATVKIARQEWPVAELLGALEQQLLAG